MSLIAQIKTDQLAARKARDVARATLLTTLIGECEMIGKNAGREVTDDEVMSRIKKFLDNANETIKLIGNTMGNDLLEAKAQAAYEEKVVLAALLPRQLTEDQLRHILGSIKNEISAGPKDMGKMLALLKTRFAGQYDGKVASTIARETLQ